MSNFTVRDVRAADVTLIDAAIKSMGWQRPEGHFGTVFAQAERGEICFLIVTTAAGDYAGHGKLVWSPGHPYFQTHAIPEIQDLVALSTYRRQGVASLLVENLEALAAERGDQIGIGFALYGDYGPAQRMYVRRGYVPVGISVSYQDRLVQPGETVPVDDDLVFVLVKSLRPSADEIARDWLWLNLLDGAVRLQYPGRTPAGHPVDLTCRERGGASQFHLISRGSQEIYFELSFYPPGPLATAWAGFQGANGQNGAVKFGPIEPGTVAGLPAELCQATFPDKERLIHYFDLMGYTGRLIFNPRSDLNRLLLSTLTFAPELRPTES
ncbi:MAG: GNAT family N-acetyltransferase [Anaerolineales bacterium]|nr:GNAT family N-acetyltransferase [Anaerolineales bacterium]